MATTIGLQTIAVNNLGGGINDYAPPDGIGADEMQNLSRNFRGDASSCKPRLGYTTFLDLQSGSIAGIAAFGAYLRNSAANDVLTMVYNNKLYKGVPGTSTTWTEITSTGLTNSASVNMIAYRDWLFIFNGVDKPIRIENTTASMPFTNPSSVSLANFLPSFGEVYKASLVVSGVPTAPNTVFISRASTATNPEYVYDFSGALTGYGDANEITMKTRVTAIRALSSALVIFTVTEAIYVPGLKEIDSTVIFDQQPIGGSGGAVSQQATCVVENDIFYLTPQKEIKSVRRSQANQENFTTTSLSTKIQRFLDANMDDDLSTAFMVYHQTKKQLHLVFKKKEGVMNFMRLVADINKLDRNGVPMWYLDDNTPFRSGIFYKDDLYYGSSILGQAYLAEDGRADDDDSAIMAVRVGKDMTGNNPTSLKNFRMVKVFGNISTGSTITVNVYVDGFLIASEQITVDDLATGSTVSGIGTAPVGDFVIGEETDRDPSDPNLYEVTKVITFRQRGKKIRVDFVSDGNNNEYKLDYIQYSFLPVSPLIFPILEQ